MGNTHQDIIDATDAGQVCHWWTGSETPIGTFAVGTVIEGAVRTYLLRGEEGDLNAPIIGKSVCDMFVHEDGIDLSEPSYYAGGGLFGGIYLNEATTDHDAMTRMANLASV